MQFKTLSYPTLAFEFQYPVTTETGRKLPVIISRKPERYSSAAPLTADARQRIVTELVDFPDGITISVSVSVCHPVTRWHDDWRCCMTQQAAVAVLAPFHTDHTQQGQLL